MQLYLSAPKLLILFGKHKKIVKNLHSKGYFSEKGASIYQKKAAEVLKTVNVNMALENQEIAEDEAVKDFASDLINTKIKQIWD